MRANNLTLLTDLYELTMMQGYFKNPTNQTVIFDMFYRTNPCGGAFAITAGLEQMIEYIENLHFTDEDIEYLRSLNTFDEDFLEYLSNFQFTGDIYAIPEGTVVFPREPLVKVVAAVRRDRMQVSLVPVPQSSADVPVLPVFSPAKCSMYRFSELMPTVGS